MEAEADDQKVTPSSSGGDRFFDAPAATVDEGTPKASASSRHNVVHRQRGSDPALDAQGTDKSGARPTSPTPLAKGKARLRTLWNAIQGKRPLQYFLRHATLALKDTLRRSKEVLERLPNEAKVGVLVLVAIIKLLFLLFVLGVGCKCKDCQRLRSQQDAPPGEDLLASLSVTNFSHAMEQQRRLQRQLEDADLGVYDGVAMCLSGDPRFLPFTGPALVRHVIQPFSSPHVFVSAKYNEHAHRLAAFAAIPSERSWELVSVRLWASPGVSKHIWESIQPHVRRLSYTVSLIDRWFLVEDAFRQVQEQEQKFSLKYKWVVQASLDQFWAAPVPPQAFDLDHEVAVPFTSTQGGLNDLASVSQRRAATRFLPRLDGLARTLGPSEGVERNGLRSSDVLFRQGLALNMMQHVGFIPLPFCRLASSAPGPILAVGSVGAMDGFPCHPCRDVVRGQQGWALATKTSPQDFAAGPVPVVLPNQIDRLEVCYGRLAPFSAPLYSEWNAGLESGKLLQAADAGVVGQTSESNPEIPPGLAAGAGKDMLAASSEWQGVPSGYRDCVEILRKLEARGGLGLFGPGGRATGQAGALAETLCTRWLMGSADRARVLEWPLFTRLLKKDSVVYQFGLGHHIAFIKGITRAFGCHVHGFDQTAGSLEWLKAQRLPQKFHHVPFMLAPQDGPLVYTDEKDGTPTFFLSSSRASGAVNGKKAPGKSLKSIMAAMGHNKVDVALLDMRGADAGIILSWKPGPQGPTICQLLVRHYEWSPSTNLPEELPLQHLSALGFVLATSTPVAKGFLSLFYHPDICLGPREQ